MGGAMQPWPVLVCVGTRDAPLRGAESAAPSRWARSTQHGQCPLGWREEAGEALKVALGGSRELLSIAVVTPQPQGHTVRVHSRGGLGGLVPALPCAG